MRTFDGATYRRIQEAWRGFGPEWREIRLIAAERGYPLPPKGESTDDREDPEPSQRSIVWRSLDFRPADTLAIARRSQSWSEVVGRILHSEEALRERAALAARDDDWYRREEQTPREATQTLGAILKRIGDSVGVTR